MTHSVKSADGALWDTAIGGGAQNAIFASSRRDNETIIAYLERLCDEHNATNSARN